MKDDQKTTFDIFTLILSKISDNVDSEKCTMEKAQAIDLATLYLHDVISYI